MIIEVEEMILLIVDWSFYSSQFINLVIYLLNKVINYLFLSICLLNNLQNNVSKLSS